VYLDESGIDNRIYKEHGYSLRGEKIIAEVCGSKKQRISIIAATCQSKIFAPFTFEGSCNTELFNTWVEQVLLPELRPMMTIVMDNASFHKSQKTVELIESAGCRVLFLPPYSPDLNPIEHFWFILKSAVKKLLTSSTSLSSAISSFFLTTPILT
jgi:transposase